MITDRELGMRFVAEGDESAFNELVDRYSGKVYQVAMGVLNDRQDAEEVVQDAFVRVYRALPNFRWDCEFSSWIYIIALNLARNKHHWNKIRGRHASISLNAPIATSKDGSDLFLEVADLQQSSPDELVDYEELEGRVAYAMAQLPESFRLAVTLRCVQHMSYEEIAAVLQCQLGTVKSKINRGREMLKCLLSAENEDE